MGTHSCEPPSPQVPVPARGQPTVMSPGQGRSNKSGVRLEVPVLQGGDELQV